MGPPKTLDLFKNGLFDEALNQINQNDKSSFHDTALKALILYYKALYQKALDLADFILDEISSLDDPIVECKARIVKGLSLRVFLKWNKAFTEINKAENLVDTLDQGILETEKIWIAELKIEKGMFTEVLFGEPDLALQFEQEGYEIFTEIGDHRGATHALNNMSMIYFWEGLLEESMNFAQRGLALSEKNDVQPGIAFSLYRIGECCYSVGKLRAAQSALERGIQVAGKIQNKWLEGELRLSLSKVFRRQGEFVMSQLELQQSLELAKEVEDRHLYAKGMLNSGELLLVRGDAHGAVENYHDAFFIFRSLNDRNCSIESNLKLGRAYLSLGEVDLAYQHFNSSFINRLWNRGDNQPTDEIPLNMFGYPETLYYLVFVSLELEAHDQAQKYLERLEKFHAKEPSAIVHYQLRLAKALVLKQSARITEKINAQSILRELVTEKTVDICLTLFATLNYCDMLISEFKSYGEPEVLDEIHGLFQKLAELGEENNVPMILIESCLLTAQVDLIERDMDKAITCLNRARHAAETKGLSHYLPKIIQQQESVNNEIRKGIGNGGGIESLQQRLEEIPLRSNLLEGLKASLIQDLGNEFFPISRKLQGPVYKLEYRDFLRAYGGIQKDTCRVAVAQIGLSTAGDVLEEFYEEFEPGLFSIKQDKVGKISTKVKELIEKAHSHGVNILLFPELSIDLNHGTLFEEISFYSKKYQMYIVAGSYHKKSTRRNVSNVISPYGILWEQGKHIPATITYEGKRFKEGIETGVTARKIIIGETEYGRMAIVICRDFLDMDLRVELKNAEPPIDLLFNLAFTPVTAEFKAAHFDARRSIYAYCFFVNIAEFGNSLIYTPEKERIERTLPAGEEGFIYKDVDLFKLRSERKRWEKNREAEKPFIQSTRQ
ncbi:MAG: nitrilase-related carbon-nitrogen hydrolase [Candidatus Thorarchaeota archaeon]